MLLKSHLQAPANLCGLICAERIQHQNLIRNSLQGCNAPSDVLLFVEGYDDGRDLQG